MYKFKVILSALLLSFTINSFAQGVSINNDESDADPSAILDVKSSTQGMLVPRMTVSEAYAISNPAEGLLVYATDIESFLYYKSGNWEYLTSEFSKQIADFDFDTKITTGNGLQPDNDIIELYLGNSNEPRFRIDSVRIEPLSDNVMFGRNAGKNSLDAHFMIAIGDSALFQSNGWENIAIGAKSMKNNTQGGANTAIGAETLYSNISGIFNTAVGYEAMYSNTLGAYNTATGTIALHENTQGVQNAAYGHAALSENTSGNNNSAFGASTLNLNQTGSLNAAFGYGSLTLNVEGNFNVAIGSGSLYSNSTGSSNSALGYNSLKSNEDGDYNVAIGYWSLTNDTNSYFNTAIGAWSLENNMNGYSNVVVGANAASQGTGMHNIVAIGDSALFNNGVGATLIEGTQNTAVGSKSLFSNNTGFINTALGFEALYNNTSGDHNTAIGALALYHNSDGTYNTTAGVSSLAYNLSGSYNAAYGNKALHFNQYGSENTAVGNNALSNNTASSNTALGNQALFTSSSGTRNTAVGSNAGTGLETGFYNTYVGAYSSSGGTAFNNSSTLGDAVTITASNQIRLGDVGIVSIGGYAGWTNISDKRFKENVKQDVPGLAFIELLEPVSYNLNIGNILNFINSDDPEKEAYLAKSGKEKIIQTGFLAQDVESAAKSIGYDFSGVDAPKNDNDTYGLRYAEFVVPLVKAVQELAEENRLLLERIEKLENK